MYNHYKFSVVISSLLLGERDQVDVFVHHPKQKGEHENFKINREVSNLQMIVYHIFEDDLILTQYCLSLETMRVGPTPPGFNVFLC